MTTLATRQITSAAIVFGGLDTFAYITLCGEEIATTNDRYLQYVFDVSDALQQCHNDLELPIKFGSATVITLAIAENLGDCKCQSRSVSNV